jgi:hypothetical protein
LYVFDVATPADSPILGTVINAHEAGITAMDVHEGRTELITGDKLGIIKIWSFSSTVIDEARTSAALEAATINAKRKIEKAEADKAVAVGGGAVVGGKVIWPPTFLYKIFP